MLEFFILKLFRNQVLHRLSIFMEEKLIVNSNYFNDQNNTYNCTIISFFFWM